MTLKHFIKQIPHFANYDGAGWGNGYVCIPKGHPLHGKDYDDIDVAVHYGLTFAAAAKDISNWPEIPKGCKTSWVVGFDTAHLGDNKEKWTEKAVEAETIRLKEQLEQIN